MLRLILDSLLLPPRRLRLAQTLLLLVALSGGGWCAAEELALTALLPAGGQRGTTVSFQAIGKFPKWPPQVWCSSDAIRVTAGSTAGALEAQIAPDAVPGRCWIRLFDSSGATGLRPFLVDSVPEVSESQDEKQREPLPVTLPAIVNGRLARRDEVDAFRIHLEKGQTLVAAVQAHRELGSPMDAVLQLADAGQNIVIDQVDDRLDLDPRLEHRVERSGDYLVRIFAFPEVPSASISFDGGEDFVYRLLLSTSGAIDHAYPLAVTADQEDQVRLVGWNLPDGPPSQSRFQDLEGIWLRNFSPTCPGWFDVEVVEGHCVWESADATLEAPLSVELPATVVSGYIDRAGDRDAAAFSGTKGEVIRLRVESRALGFLTDPVLEIFDASGKSLARQDDTRKQRDCQLDFRIPEYGIYRAVVSDLHQRGGRPFAYRLTISTARPTFRLEVESDRFQGKAGEPLEIPVKVAWDEGLTGAVTLHVDGLPETVEAPPVTVEPGDKREATATVTLTSGQPHAGPLRIVGSIDGSSETILCTAPTVVSDCRTADLWVTFQ